MYGGSWEQGPGKVTSASLCLAEAGRGPHMWFLMGRVGGGAEKRGRCQEEGCSPNPSTLARSTERYALGGLQTR